MAELCMCMSDQLIVAPHFEGIQKLMSGAMDEIDGLFNRKMDWFVNQKIDF